MAAARELAGAEPGVPAHLDGATQPSLHRTRIFPP